MRQRNNSKDEVFAVENRFTAYLLTALKRTKRDYIEKNTRLESREIPTDFRDSPLADELSHDIEESFPFLLQIENLALIQALSHLTSKERNILLGRVLYGTEYDRLAAELGLRYSGAAAAYHRIIKKLKKELKGGQK